MVLNLLWKRKIIVREVSNSGTCWSPRLKLILHFPFFSIICFSPISVARMYWGAGMLFGFSSAGWRRHLLLLLLHMLRSRCLCWISRGWGKSYVVLRHWREVIYGVLALRMVSIFLAAIRSRTGICIADMAQARYSCTTNSAYLEERSTRSGKR